MKKNVIFILGSPFSGSTLLGNILNSHRNITFLGEVDRIQSFERWEMAPENYSSECMICSTATHGDGCTFWTEELLEKIKSNDLKGSYQAILDAADTEWVVDGSKSADWIADLFDHGLDANFSAIICARLPWAFALSNKGATENLLGSPLPVYRSAEMWRDIYTHCARVLSFRNIPATTIQYENLINNAEKTLLPLIGSIGEGSTLSIHDYPNHPLHPIGGNHSAYVHYSNFSFEGFLKSHPNEREKIELWRARNCLPKLKDRWLTELNDTEVASIIHTPGLTDLASLLGYDLAHYIAEYGFIKRQTREAF